MSHTVIEDVSNTLISLLKDKMSGPPLPVPADEIVLLSPVEVEGQQVRVGLFLYAIVENPYLKNAERQITSPTKLQYPPLTLDLYYLLTAYAREANVSDSVLEAHQIMGRAMQIFYDNGILSGTALKGSLADRQEELRLTLNPISVEDLTRIWSVFPNRPYRPSVSYLATPARIVSERDEDVNRVVSKEMDHGQAVPNRRRL
jgi:hypothetical protein